MENTLTKPEPHSRDSKRIYLLDEIRAAAIIAMVIYHFFYSASEVFGFSAAKTVFQTIMPFEPIIPVTFIFISGICTRLSRSNLKRGAILFAAAIFINNFTITFVPEIAIRFGVINLLSVSMILYGILEKPIHKLNAAIVFSLSLIIFCLTWGVKLGYIGFFGLVRFPLPDHLYGTEYLFPLGFRNAAFYSSDYFPLLPWFFLFLSGSFFWETVCRRDLPESIYNVHSKFLCKTGKHALIIYIVHQPIIFGVLYLAKNFLFR